MSADNRTVCPQCETNEENDHQSKIADYNKQVEDVKAQYGTLTAEEFLQQMLALKEKEPVEEGSKPEEETNLREYYALGVCDGEFYVNYRAECVVCGWKFKFDYKGQLPHD